MPEVGALAMEVAAAPDPESMQQSMVDEQESHPDAKGFLKKMVTSSSRKRIFGTCAGAHAKRCLHAGSATTVDSNHNPVPGTRGILRLSMLAAIWGTMLAATTLARATVPTSPATRAPRARTAQAANANAKAACVC